MKKNKIFKTILWCLLSLIVVGCSSHRDQDINITTLTVSILPIKEMVEKITGDLVRVQVMLPKGSSPATYEPLPSQMLALTRSTYYFKVGVPFEKKWLGKIAEANPKMTIIDLTEGIIFRNMNESFVIEHRDHHEHHDHGGDKDPHIWTSPKNIKIMADTIYKMFAKSKRFSEKEKDGFKRNLVNYQKELDDLDRELKSKFKELENKNVLTFHPAWGYFLDEMGMEQYAVEVSGKSPTPKELAKIIELAKELNPKYLFVQPQFSKKSAASIAREINAKVVIIDPLAENSLDNLREVSKKIIESFDR